MVVERQEWGRFYGTAVGIQQGEGTAEAATPEAAWKVIQEQQPAMRALWRKKREIEYDEIGRINRRIENARLEQRKAELEHGANSRDFKLAYDDVVDACVALTGSKDADLVVDILDDQVKPDTEKAAVKKVLQKLKGKK